jgi:hypothetical protein
MWVLSFSFLENNAQHEKNKENKQYKYNIQLERS